jgi:hypothetical protein
VPGQEPVPGQVPVRVPGQVPEAEVQAAWGLEQVLALGRVRVRETRESARALGLVPHCFRSAPGGSTHCCRLHILQWPLSGTAR